MSSNREIKTFEDLKVWQKARELRNRMFELTEDLPDEERYRLKDQMIRASRSITANISEGYGRFSLSRIYSVLQASERFSI